MIYIDVLAYHPKPKTFESFTGYLTRIAENLQLKSVDGLAALCFPQTSARSVRKLSDYGVSFPHELLTKTSVSESELRATTFRPLSMKFGRSEMPQAISRFLSDAVVSVMRWCPLCLADDIPIRKLIWRFRALTQCNIHYCDLVGRCPTCQKHIPLLVAPFSVLGCPVCGSDLANKAISYDCETLSPSTNALYNTFSFLISPQPWEENRNVIGLVGKLLQTYRLSEHISLNRMIELSGCNASSLECIEGANLSTRGAGFEDYARYSQVLGLELSEVFTEAVILLESKTYEKSDMNSHEEALLRQVREAIQELNREHLTISQRRVAALLKVSRATIQSYPKVKDEIRRHSSN